MDSTMRDYERELARISENEKQHMAAADDCDARSSEIMAKLEHVGDDQPELFASLHDELERIQEEKEVHQQGCVDCAQQMIDAAPPMFYGLDDIPAFSKPQQLKKQAADQITDNQ